MNCLIFRTCCQNHFVLIVSGNVHNFHNFLNWHCFVGMERDVDLFVFLAQRVLQKGLNLIEWNQSYFAIVVNVVL